MGRNPDQGTVFADPEELNNYVREQTERDVQETYDRIEREQEDARNRRNSDS